MENLIVVLQILILILVGWFMLYFPSYMQKKGANRAAFEDAAGITSETERGRYVYVSDLAKLQNSLQEKLENLRTDLQKTSEAETKKREVYHEMVMSMGVFIAERKSDDEREEKFLTDCSRMWLWAPDSVVRALNELIDSNTPRLNPDGLNQEKIKRAYVTCVLEMRRDAAYPNTMLDHDDHRIVSY